MPYDSYGLICPENRVHIAKAPTVTHDPSSLRCRRGAALGLYGGFVFGGSDKDRRN